MLKHDEFKFNLDELRYKPFIREDRIPASNLIINMLFLKTIGKDFNILKDKESFDAAMRFQSNLRNADYKNPLADAQVLQKKASEYYGKPELEAIPLGVDTKSINEAMKDETVNNLCDLLLSMKDNEYSRFLSYLRITLNNLCRMGGRVNRNTEMMNLSSELMQVISFILDVKDDETFADFASGYGISTLFILGEHNPKTILRDNAKDSLALSEMLLIAADKNIDNTKVADIFVVDENEDIKADKIFIDPPFRTSCEGTCTSIDGIELKDAWVAAIMKSVKALKDDGIAIIAVPAIVLHGVQNGLKEVREYLLDKHLLRAVASLPSCWRNSSTPTHLLILSKRNNTKARFVNYISIEEFYSASRYQLLDLLTEILHDKPSSDFSKYMKDVDYEDISAESFIAGVYISYCETKDYRKDDIDAKLKNLYREMGKTIEDLLK